MSTKKICCIFFAAILLLIHTGAPAKQADEKLFSKAKRYLQQDKYDLAFLSLRELVFNHPQSEYLDESLYHIVSYHMRNHNYFEASRLLKKHLDQFPDSPHHDNMVLFAQKINLNEQLKNGEQALRRNNYELAMFYYQEVLKADPEHQIAKKRIDHINEILIYSDYRKIQLEKEKKRIEAESRAIAQEMAHIEQQRLQIEEERLEVAQTDKATREKYQAMLDESLAQRKALENRVDKLMQDLDSWKQRAKIYEAKMLAEPNITGLKLITQTEDLPRIIFEGPSNKDLAPGEVQLEKLLKPQSPSAVLVSETRDDQNNIVTAEFVVSVDLNTPWPKGALLKLRVDFFNLLSDNTPTRVTRPKIIYYTLSDMDEIDKENLSYRKKVMMSVGDKQFQKFETTVSFIK